MKMHDKMYDFLKWFCMIALPAMITFYGVIGATCNIPYTQETLTIAVAFNTMLGTMLGISNSNYKKNH